MTANDPLRAVVDAIHSDECGVYEKEGHTFAEHSAYQRERVEAKAVRYAALAAAPAPAIEVEVLRDAMQEHSRTSDRGRQHCYANSCAIDIARLLAERDAGEGERRLIEQMGQPEPSAQHPLEPAPPTHASTANGYHAVGCRALGCV